MVRPACSPASVPPSRTSIRWFDTGAQWAIASNRAGLNNAVLTGYTRSDTIDLSSVAPTDVSISYVADIATVTITGGDHFTVAGAFANLAAQSDGAGGTLLVVAPIITADTASAATGDYTTGKVISFTLTTNEAVTVAGTPTLTLNDGGTASDISGSGTNSLVFSTIVAAGQNAAALAVTGVIMPAGASITDGAGNAAVLTGAAATFTGLQIDTTSPVVASATLTAAENSAATSIGVTEPADTGSTNSQLTITAGALPTDDAVTLADGVAVFPGQVLTSAQLAGLQFTPTAGTFGQSSTFTYTVIDPANNASAGTATLATGPAVGNPTVSSPSVTIAENSVATAIGIAAPTDPNYMTSELTITAGAQPTDGVVTLDDGSTVVAGLTLSSTQLAGLLLTPNPGMFGQSSSFTYTVTDPANNASAGAATLAIGSAVGNPVVSSPTVTATENGPAMAIGIAAPTDPNYHDVDADDHRRRAADGRRGAAG